MLESCGFGGCEGSAGECQEEGVGFEAVEECFGDCSVEARACADELFEVVVEEDGFGGAAASGSAAAGHDDFAHGSGVRERGDFFVGGGGAVEEGVHVCHGHCWWETLPESQDLGYAHTVEAAALRDVVEHAASDVLDRLSDISE